MAVTPDRLFAVDLDDSALPAPTPDIEQERRVAIFDLLEENRFRPRPEDGRLPPSGPFRLVLALRERQLAFDLWTASGEPAGDFRLSLSAFTQAIKDYGQICESYFNAVKHLPPAQIEAIDAGRRAIHDEGARLLVDRLDPHVETDTATARRLFTLLCVLHPV
jgi:uncharacterized protein (UPF0262 family)